MTWHLWGMMMHEEMKGEASKDRLLAGEHFRNAPILKLWLGGRGRNPSCELEAALLAVLKATLNAPWAGPVACEDY